MNTKIKSLPYTIKTNGSVTLYLNGECLTIATDHPNYTKVIDALKRGDFDLIDGLVNVVKAITSYAGGKISIKHGEVFYGDFALHNTLTSRILKMMGDGFKFEHMLAFLSNLMQNPSNRAVNETYTFLENYGLPITDDGCFLAYKAVRNDYKDIYSGKVDNRIGATPSMPRNQVDEDYERDCSTGLHVGALDYVVQYGHFRKGSPVPLNGNRLLIVKVNPKDVVSVPNYENHPKMRVCTYTVVNEILDVVKELDKVVYTSKATDLTPDNTAPTPPKQVVDVSSPWNEAKYREGFAVGLADLNAGRDYGTNRNYSEVNSYRLGYNDAFNQRGNRADALAAQGEPCECSCDCGCDESESGPTPDNQDYCDGYEAGRLDAESNSEYQNNLSIDSSNAFKEGYEDGYFDHKE